MKETGLIFTGESVRAIQEGRKTQTWRIVKLPAEFDAVKISGPDSNGKCHVWEEEYPEDGSLIIRCPYGVPGRIWVKETWAWPGEEEKVYRADEGADDMKAYFDKQHAENPNFPTFKWSSARFMPRRVSRITLEITDVRVQRLKEISEEDCYSEGIEKRYCGTGNGCTCEQDPIGEFADLWDQINGKRAPWDSNPWVWAISFKRLEVAQAA